jgi:hypothetical protein
MGEFFVRVATPADADRLWPLFDEAEKRGPRLLAALLGVEDELRDFLR